MKYLIILTTLINSSLISANLTPNQPRVNLSLGVIEGFTATSLEGKPFAAFEGVPYAVPPIGKRRFKEPTLWTKPWRGVWQAKTLHKCLQYFHYYNPIDGPIVGEEDCLYLNIYTANLNANVLYDVIVYIHGGAFMFNSAGLQRPDHLLDRKVVLVTINYRLGPLGFLSTESDLVPGNNGIRDQITALEWVQKHISAFGGDPKSVTLVGMSAGGASVHLHYLSPKSRGLYVRGVSQSGCALNPWVLMEGGLEKTQKLASLVGCDFEGGLEAVVGCLKKRPAVQIVGAVKYFQRFMYTPFSPFGVVVDEWSSDPVLPEHPYVLLQNGKFNTEASWIVSNTNAEGLYPAADFYTEDGHILSEIDQRWDEIAPLLLDYNYTLNAKHHKKVNAKIREFYMKNTPLTISNYKNFVEIVSDRIFNVDLYKCAKLHANSASKEVYYYFFTYRGAHSRSELITHTDINFGACHGDDTNYIVNMLNFNTTSTENDRLMVKIMLDLVTDFARNGRPNEALNWKPVSNNLNDSLIQLKIADTNEIHSEINENAIKIVEFWNSLSIKENEVLVNSNNIAKDEL